jgi:hypothetical protein
VSPMAAGPNGPMISHHMVGGSSPNVSPMIMANPSTFTVSTQYKSSSPHTIHP